MADEESAVCLADSLWESAISADSLLESSIISADSLLESISFSISHQNVVVDDDASLPFLSSSSSSSDDGSVDEKQQQSAEWSSPAVVDLNEWKAAAINYRCQFPNEMKQLASSSSNDGGAPLVGEVVVGSSSTLI